MASKILQFGTANTRHRLFAAQVATGIPPFVNGFPDCGQTKFQHGILLQTKSLFAMIKNMTALFLTLFFTVSLFAQKNTGSISGTVITNDNKPGASVTVFVSGVNKFAQTNDDGTFSLNNLSVGTYNIEVSLVGYETLTQSVNITADKTVSVHLQLKLSDKQLKEVIITSGYKFKSTTSDYANKMPLANLENAQSYSAVTKDLIKDQVLFTVDDALRNVSGMQKMWDATGRAGDGGAYYNMRGFTSQITMRDGVASMITSTADAANIEKIEVLKGPSATLYGTALTSYGGLINRVTKNRMILLAGK